MLKQKSIWKKNGSDFQYDQTLQVLFITGGTETN